MTNDLYQTALRRLNDLLADGWNRGLEEVNAGALATADSKARPSVRMVNILAIETEGLLFLMNRNTGKSQQLQENPRASLCFFWPLLREQVIVEGTVKPEDKAVSDRYWKKMSREKQVYTHVTAQLPPSQRSGTLREEVNEQWPNSGFAPISRPADWQAFRLLPDKIEFWPSGWRRARERVQYTQNEEGEWCRKLVNP
jgi:pyridoxamine 5'-phosphate oxidase